MMPAPLQNEICEPADKNTKPIRVMPDGFVLLWAGGRKIRLSSGMPIVAVAKKAGFPGFCSAKKKK
jgi:hypothetical protein